MPLRLEVGVEAATVKYLAATVNDVIARIRNGETQGEVLREGRRAWFRVERANAEALEAPEAPGVAPPEPQEVPQTVAPPEPAPPPSPVPLGLPPLSPPPPSAVPTDPTEDVPAEPDSDEGPFTDEPDAI